MSMFQITGQVMNVFHQPGRPDKETGEMKEGKDKVQIMGELPVPDGGTRFDLVTLSVPDDLDFSIYKNQKVSVPLGFFSPAKGSIVYFIPRGSEVTPKIAA